MKVFIHSCHAALEYDHAQMLTNMGCEVTGRFDLGSVERPKLVGVTSVSRDPEGEDVILLHQCEDYPKVMRKYLIDGYAVVLSVFGQGCDEQHQETVGLCQTYKKAFVSPYSITDYLRLKNMGMPTHKMELIRFGKDLSFYNSDRWNGRLPCVYVTGNAIHRRGDGCGWPIVKELMSRGVPIILGGSETDTGTSVGLGQLGYSTMVAMFHNVRCYLAMGTVPAPYTLSLIEAMCAGCPVVAYDSGSGIRNEDFGVILARDVDEINHYLNTFLTNSDTCKNEHNLMSSQALRLFDMKKIQQQWFEFLMRMVR